LGENKENQNKRKSIREAVNKRKSIIEAVIFILISIIIIKEFKLSNESLLLALLIFGIYLIVSGRIRQIKFKDMEIMLKESQLKPLGSKESLTKSFSSEDMPEIITTSKDSLAKLPGFLKKLQENPKNIRVLVIKHKEGSIYEANALRIYLQYFTHVVFLDKEGKLNGYANAIDLINIFDSSKLFPLLGAPITHESDFEKFVNSLNTWPIEYPLLIKTYVVLGMSRKQILDKMSKTGYYTLPVVGDNFEYLGFINHETVITQILNDLYSSE